MTEREWKDSEQECHYFYERSNGLIVGQVHKFAHTKIWVAKIIFGHADEKYLGQYITCQYAMKSVERFWEIQDRTLIE